HAAKPQSNPSGEMTPGDLWLCHRLRYGIGLSPSGSPSPIPCGVAASTRNRKRFAHRRMAARIPTFVTPSRL
ncbi:MAG TPA: hypothetical protein VKB26_00535, partial [Candidatus Acidoferrales bacterium]|nr:hypothetical protein [Candidatus Acidoferrales bacterium]